MFIDPLNTGLAFLPVQFSRNQIEHVIDPADTSLASRAGLRYYLELLIPDFAGSSTFERLVKMPGAEKPPTGRGGLSVYEGAFFQLDELLDGFLTYQKPAFGSTEMAVISTLTMPYLVRETVTNNGQLLPASTKQRAGQWILKAGLTERDFAAWGNAFFTDYMSANRPFLSWQPEVKTIGEKQQEFLSFLLNISPLPASLIRRCRVHYLDGSTVVIDAGTLVGGQSCQVVSVPVYPAALGLVASNVDYYEVWLTDENRNRLSRVQTYYVDHTYRSQERWLLFANSLAGWDTLRLLGEGSETLNTTRTTAEMERPAGAAADFAELRVINVAGSRELTVNTGYFEQAAHRQLKHLDELLLSKEIYLVDGRGHQALELLTTSLVDNEDNADLLARTLTFKLATPQQNHSALPTAPATVARPTKWRGIGVIYDLDALGKRTGQGRPLKLQKYYVDDNSTYKPLTEKPNQPGDPDYITTLPIPGIVAGTTPFASQALTRATTFKRANCPNGQMGDVATIAIAMGKYGSENSQGDADSKAEAEYKQLNTQDYANQYGACTAAPENYQVALAQNTWCYRVSDASRFEVYWYLAYTNELTLGNTWNIQGQMYPYVYPRFSTDLIFPTKAQPWNLYVYGPAYQTVNLKTYVNGALVNDRTFALNRDGYELLVMPVNPVSGDKVYFKLANV